MTKEELDIAEKEIARCRKYGRVYMVVPEDATFLINMARWAIEHGKPACAYDGTDLYDKCREALAEFPASKE